MRALDRLERRVGRFAIPNLTLWLVGGQGLAFILQYLQPGFVDQLLLIPELVAHGEVWRLFTFLFVPPDTHPVFVLLGLYFFWIMGSALEGLWGEFRFNVYVVLAWLATILAALPFPLHAAGPAFIAGSVFLAFAWLHPEFVIYLFFVLPVKIKWLALLTWIGYGWTLLFGAWPSRALVVASIANFLLFFGRDIWLRARYGARKMASHGQRIATENRPIHRCAVCGVTDKSDPDMDFRYCSRCDGVGYCRDHIASHGHVTAS